MKYDLVGVDGNAFAVMVLTIIAFLRWLLADVELIDDSKPWCNAPKNIIFYDKFFDDGHVGAFTDNPELAYKLGWFYNRVRKSDLYRAENGWVYLKNFRTL